MTTPAARTRLSDAALLINGALENHSHHCPTLARLAATMGLALLRGIDSHQATRLRARARHCLGLEARERR